MTFLAITLMFKYILAEHFFLLPRLKQDVFLMQKLKLHVT